MEQVKQRIFYVFLLINTIVWSLLPNIKFVPSYDSMEAICWGELISFGTNKHPPLSGWIISSFYHLCGDNNFIIYLIGQLCILVGFIFVYKIAKIFVSEEKAICSAMILEACFYNTYCCFIDNFNCNIILVPLWVMAIYYFYKGVHENKISQWILFGLVSGLAFMGKYQIVFLFAAMFIYLLIAKKEVFKQKGMYIAIFVGILIILPHVLWLLRTNFFSFAYMIERTHAESGLVPAVLVKLGHIFFPIKFYLGQLFALTGCIVVYAITALQAGNIKYKNDEDDRSDKIFLLTIFFVPILLQGLMGFFTGERVPSIWGSIMISLGGLILYYFFPINFKESTFKFFTKLIYATMAIFVMITLCIAYLQTNSVMFIPIQKLEQDINHIWSEKTNNAPLKYIGGDEMATFPIKHFNINKPTMILNTYGYKNPWVDHECVLDSGVIILVSERLIEEGEDVVRSFVPLLPIDYKIDLKKYSYDVCNIFGKCKEKHFYYSIIPPQK